MISCGNKNNSNSTIQYHPMEERMPYRNANVPVIEIEANNYAEIATTDQNLIETEHFQSVINISGSETIPEFLPDNWSMKVISIDENRLLILHSQTELYEYNIPKQSWTKIAGEGRGPGDLMYASDINKHKNSVYVSTEDYRISKFDCTSEPCTYNETIPVEKLRPYSVAVANNKLAILAPASGLPNLNNMDDSLSTLHYLNENGEIIESFGEVYDVKGQWILSLNINRNNIKGLELPDHSLLQYNRMMPYFYLFDDTSLNKKYKFQEFNQGYIELNLKSMASTIPQKPWTFIQNVAIVNDSLLIAELIQNNDPANRDERSHDFYLINLINEKSTLLGQTHLINERLWFTDKHILEMKNEDWMVYSYSVE